MRKLTLAKEALAELGAGELARVVVGVERPDVDLNAVAPSPRLVSEHPCFAGCTCYCA